MKNLVIRLISVAVSVVLLAGMFVVAPFATDADIALRASEESCMQGETITVEVFFPSDFKKISSGNFELTYDSTQLEVTKVKKGQGFISAANEQTQTDVFSENHKTAGVIKWGFAGINNYNFSGVFSEITFAVKSIANHGECNLNFAVKSASDSSYNDMKSSITVSGTSFEITRNTENDLVFQLNDDASGYIIKNYICGSVSELVIPSTHEGLPVVAIGPSAFSSHVELKNVTIPDTVTSIGFQAFKGCYSITDLVIPNSVTKIDDMAFSGCGGMKTVEMSVRLETLGEEAFSNCPLLAEIELPFTLKTIGERAFANCYSLSSVKISKSTLDLGNKVFYECNSRLKFYTTAGNTTLPEYLKSGSMSNSIITLKDLSLGVVEPIEDQVYTGDEVKPNVKINLTNSENVTLDKDYRIVYFNNIEKGTATAYIIGKGDYGEGYIVNFNIKCMHTMGITKTVGKEATCTEDGYFNCTCDICKESFTEVIKATGHHSDTWIYDKLPTIYATGLKHKVCDYCSEKIETNTVVPKVFPDLNSDRRTNAADALIILQYATGNTEYISTEEMRLNADLNGDGKINSVDALMLLQISIGTIVL